MGYPSVLSQIFESGMSYTENRQFEELFDKYYSKVLGYCRMLVGTSQVIEDIAQDVFMKLWQDKELLEDVRSMDSFIYVVTRHKVLDYLKSSARKNISLNELNWLEGSSFGAGVSSIAHDDNSQFSFQAEDDFMLNDALAEFLDSLPQKRREIFVLSRFYGYSNKEIAKMAGISKKTVENHIHNALGQVKRFLSLALQK